MNFQRIIKVIYSCYFALVITIGFILHFFVAGIFMWISKDPEYAHLKLTRPFIRFGLGMAGIKITANGLNNLPQEGSFIIMANHKSLLDVLVYLMVVPHKIAFIPKKELLKVPILGLDISLQGHYPIDRSNPRLALKTIEIMKKDVAGGRPLLFFPEGTRSDTGKLGAFKRGGFLLALETGTKIIPSYIDGTDKIYAKNDLFVTPGEIKVTFGSPLLVEKTASNNKDAYIGLMEEVRKAILKLEETTKNQ